jgi:hypothetical protein
MSLTFVKAKLPNPLNLKDDSADFSSRHTFFSDLTPHGESRSSPLLPASRSKIRNHLPPEPYPAGIPFPSPLLLFPEDAPLFSVTACTIAEKSPHFSP